MASNQFASTSGGSSGGGIHTAKLTCKYHPDSLLVEDFHAGDLVCSDCGLVVGDRIIDVGSEWRTFSSDKGAKDMCRVGAAENPLLDGGELSTLMVSGRDTRVDENGRSLYRNRRMLDNNNRTLLASFKEINHMAERLPVPKMVTDRANALFKQVYETKMLRGRSNEAIASAALYMACRQEGTPRTFKEVCGVSRVSKKEIGKVFKKILKTLETNVETISTGDFMSRFCSNLELGAAVQRAATTIAQRAVEFDLVAGRSPISIAAAAIYMASQASDMPKEKKEIGDIAGVAEATITCAYKMMRNRVRALFPVDFKFTVLPESLPWQ